MEWIAQAQFEDIQMFHYALRILSLVSTTRALLSPTGRRKKRMRQTNWKERRLSMQSNLEQYMAQRRQSIQGSSLPSENDAVELTSLMTSQEAQSMEAFMYSDKASPP